MAVAKEKINPQKPPRLARKSSKLKVDLPYMMPLGCRAKLKASTSFLYCVISLKKFVMSAFTYHEER